MNGKIISILKKLIKPVGQLLTILSIIFIIYSVYKLGFDFSSIDNWRIFAVAALLGILVKSATVFITGAAWASWLKVFSGGREFKKWDALMVYVKANIGKYLPGNVMHYVERNLFASGLGISQKRIALSSAAEIICQLAAAFIMALLMSYKYLVVAVKEIFKGRNIIYAIIILAAVIICGCVLFVFRKRAKAFFNEFGAAVFIKALIVTLLEYAAALWLLGFIMAALYGYMGGELTLSKANLIISGYVIAWVLGFVTPGASGGIGVRELVIVLLLSSVIGEELVLTLSVVHRLITIAGDFLSYFIVLIFNGKYGRKGKNSYE